MTTLLKGVVIRRGKVLLAKCAHDRHWELPGGPGDPDAGPPETVLAELLRSRTGQAARVGPEVYDFLLSDGDHPVAQILAFGCHLQGRLPLQISDTYRQVAWLPVDELPEHNLVDGYIAAIRAWEKHPEQVGFATTDFG
jgi:ADP-ribose pyrophosphatase YjhB (NUDIX family)